METQKKSQPSKNPGSARIFPLVSTFPKEFERGLLEGIDNRFYLILLSSLVIVYGTILYMANVQYSQELMDEAFKKKYLQKIYQAEFIEETQQAAEASDDGEGGVTDQPEEAKPQQDARSERDQGRRAEATGTSAQERRDMRQQAAAQRQAQRAAMEQAVAGTGILAELSAGGGGGSGDAVYDVLGESGGGGVGNLDQVLSGVGNLQTASSSSQRTVLGARSSGKSGNAAGIDDLIESGAGPAGSVTISRQGNLSFKMEKGTVSGKGSRSANRSSDAIEKVVNSHAASIEDCYKREARTNPNLKGSISVQFTIKADGRVSDVRIIESTLRNSKVESCVRQRINSWRFEPINENEGDATFRQKFIFSS